MTKDELKNRISMALKDTVLQQGFEIICKENAKLKDKNKALEQYADLADGKVDEVKEQLTKAKEIIKGFLNADSELDMLKAQWEAKKFLDEVSE